MWVYAVIPAVYLVLFFFAKGLFMAAARFLNRNVLRRFGIPDEKLRIALMIVFAANALGCLLSCSDRLNDTVAQGYLLRGGYGTETYTESLNLTLGGEAAAGGSTASESIASESIASESIASESIVSESIASESTVSENTASENLVSESTVSGNPASESEAPYEGTPRHTTIGVDVAARAYRQSEIEAMLSEAAEALHGLAFGEMNPSHIDRDVNFVSSVENLPVKIFWMTDTPDVLDWDGKICDGISADGTPVILTAEISYEGREDAFTGTANAGESRTASEESQASGESDTSEKSDISENSEASGLPVSADHAADISDPNAWKMKELSFTVTVFPKRLTADEQLAKNAAGALEKSNDPTDEKLYLPAEIGGEKAVWSRKTSDSGRIFPVLGLLFAVLFIFAGFRNKQKEQEVRKARLLLDYPNVISKLVLLLNAGMSMRQAFYKMSGDYKKSAGESNGFRSAGANPGKNSVPPGFASKTSPGTKSGFIRKTVTGRYSGSKKKQKKEICLHPGFEEISLTCAEMEKGISELEAYEHLGSRTDAVKYKTLATLLTQNLRKGSRELVNLLEQEAADAFEERKKQARILGEEAGTKLLFPMILMLGVVMAILMVPAFVQF